ncbi:uncharacterized protein LOC135488022 isoform X2 [Lineus longissimus]|uniref:uncharacterized protein LOC135488022 isoform X2 n=1 Tax=Lineus longissimus TaxID=88925 RepID=UPI002B4E54E8
MERRKRSANQEPVIVLDEEEKMEPIHKLLKLDRDKVKTIQSEMRTKGLVLSQTWSDLYSLMSRYQAELITREDQLIDIESQLDAQRNIARDNELERMKLQMQAKDREIKTIHMDMLNKSELLVKTQNELGRVKCLLRSKDDLIRKLQCEVKVEEDSVMAGDSPAEQVSTKTATSATSSSGTGTDTSSLIIEQTHLEEHVQTNFSRSGSDDSGTGAEKTDAKYQVSSSNDEETDSFLPLESDVATINIPGQDSGVLEEVQPGTSATDDTGQCLPRIVIDSVTSLSHEPTPPQPSSNWPVLHYLLTKEGQSRSTNGPTTPNIPKEVSSPVIPVGAARPGPGVPAAQVLPNSGHHCSTEVQGQLPRSFDRQGQSMSGVQVKVEPVDEAVCDSRDVPDQRVDHSRTTRMPGLLNSLRTETLSSIKTEAEIHMCGSCGVDFQDAETLLEHSHGCDEGGILEVRREVTCRVCQVTFGNAVELLSHLYTHSGTWTITNLDATG